MSFLDLAKARCSVRKFKDKAVEEEVLQSILEAGRVAPTACNNQPQKIYVVRSSEALEKLSRVCKYTFGAPVILVIGYDKDRDWKNDLMQGYTSGETDAAIVCTHMMLEAWDKGVGSCWVGWFNAEQIRETLELPQNVQVTALLPIGYAADDAKPSRLHCSFREGADTIAYI